MNRTKVILLAMVAMTLLLVSMVAVPATTLAAEKDAAKQEQEEVSFAEVTGTIESVEERDNGIYYTIKDGDDTNVLVVTSETLVLDNTGEKAELEEGVDVTAYTDARKPMLFIYPPQYSPEVVIVETEEAGTATVGTFDQNLLDPDLSLKLNIGTETELASFSGKEVESADLEEQDLLVFYTVTTRSIPAQTTPHQVIVLDQNASDKHATNSVREEAIDSSVAADRDEDGTKKGSFRQLAKKLVQGYLDR